MRVCVRLCNISALKLAMHSFSLSLSQQGFNLPNDWIQHRCRRRWRLKNLRCSCLSLCSSDRLSWTEFILYYDRELVVPWRNRKEEEGGGGVFNAIAVLPLFPPKKVLVVVVTSFDRRGPFPPYIYKLPVEPPVPYNPHALSLSPPSYKLQLCIASLCER